MSQIGGKSGFFCAVVTECNLEQLKSPCVPWGFGFLMGRCSDGYILVRAIQNAENCYTQRTNRSVVEGVTVAFSGTRLVIGRRKEYSKTHRRYKGAGALWGVFFCVWYSCTPSVTVRVLRGSGAYYNGQDSLSIFISGRIHGNNKITGRRV